MIVSKFIRLKLTWTVYAFSFSAKAKHSTDVVTFWPEVQKSVVIYSGQGAKQHLTTSQTCHLNISTKHNI